MGDIKASGGDCRDIPSLPCCRKLSRTAFIMRYPPRRFASDGNGKIFFGLEISSKMYHFL
jgi:hypothetical protein